MYIYTYIYMYIQTHLQLNLTALMEEKWADVALYSCLTLEFTSQAKEIVQSDVQI
jgi:hypothetical protein